MRPSESPTHYGRRVAAQHLLLLTDWSQERIAARCGFKSATTVQLLAEKPLLPFAGINRLRLNQDERVRCHECGGLLCEVPCRLCVPSRKHE